MPMSRESMTRVVKPIAVPAAAQLVRSTTSRSCRFIRFRPVCHHRLSWMSSGARATCSVCLNGPVHWPVRPALLFVPSFEVPSGGQSRIVCLANSSQPTIHQPLHLRRLLHVKTLARLRLIPTASTTSHKTRGAKLPSRTARLKLLILSGPATMTLSISLERTRLRPRPSRAACGVGYCPSLFARRCWSFASPGLVG